jgi:hypothetical protein
MVIYYFINVTIEYTYNLIPKYLKLIIDNDFHPSHAHNIYYIHDSFILCDSCECKYSHKTLHDIKIYRLIFSWESILNNWTENVNFE